MTQDEDNGSDYYFHLTFGVKSLPFRILFTFLTLGLYFSYLFLLVMSGYNPRIMRILTNIILMAKDSPDYDVDDCFCKVYLQSCNLLSSGRSLLSLHARPPFGRLLTYYLTLISFSYII